MDIQAKPTYQATPQAKPAPMDSLVKAPVSKTSEASSPDLPPVIPSDSVSDGLFALQGSAKQILRFDPSEVQLPDLPQDNHRFNGGYTEQDGNKINFYHGALSTDKPILSIEARLPRPEDHARAHAETARSFGHQEVEAARPPKIRSPYLKELGQQTAENLIRNPIEAAWERKEFTGEAGRGALIAGALVGAALYAGTDTKFSTRLAKTEMAGHDISLKTGLSAGHGDIGMRSVELSFRPKDQADNVHSGYDLKYDLEEKRVNLSYSRTVDYGGLPNDRSIGHFNASVFHEQEKSNTGVRLSYHLNF
jgi:hypothetical protein